MYRIHMYTVYVDWLYKDIRTVQGLPTKEQFCSLDLNEENIHTYICKRLAVYTNHIRTVYVYRIHRLAVQGHTVQGLPTKEQFCSLDLNEENIPGSYG